MSFYISNKEFTASVVEYINECNEREARGEEIGVIPDNVARQFLLIANRLGSRYNFSGYTFIDEMISNALYACCTKIRKFDVTVSSNGFAYFTAVCWRAMVDVINAEEKMSYIKAKSFHNLFFDNPMAATDLSDDDEGTGENNTFITYFDIEEYERKAKIRQPKEEKKKVKPAENALDV